MRRERIRCSEHGLFVDVDHEARSLRVVHEALSPGSPPPPGCHAMRLAHRALEDAGARTAFGPAGPVDPKTGRAVCQLERLADARPPAMAPARAPSAAPAPPRPRSMPWRPLRPPGEVVR